MMTLQQIEQMFANMRAQTKWDVDGEMLWGYFFTDPDTNKLTRASQRLTASGYRLVQIYPTDDKATVCSMSSASRSTRHRRFRRATANSRSLPASWACSPMTAWMLDQFCRSEHDDNLGMNSPQNIQGSPRAAIKYRAYFLASGALSIVTSLFIFAVGVCFIADGLSPAKSTVIFGPFAGAVLICIAIAGFVLGAFLIRVGRRAQ